jgi:IrrE N-terminal-like domain
MFRRGFKSWCEETAVKVRTHQGLAPTDALSPFVLARELRVRVIEPAALTELPEDVRRRLLGQHSDCWSAITIPGKRRPLVVYNPAHSAARQNSDLMHELAHIFLGHKPTMLFLDPSADLALRTHDNAQEEEANWFAGCLLLPREVLLHIKAIGLSDESACRQYGVSAKMLVYRMNVSGVNLQHRRSQAWRKPR